MYDGISALIPSYKEGILLFGMQCITPALKVLLQVRYIVMYLGTCMARVSMAPRIDYNTISINPGARHSGPMLLGPYLISVQDKSKLYVVASPLHRPPPLSQRQRLAPMLVEVLPHGPSALVPVALEVATALCGPSPPSNAPRSPSHWEGSSLCNQETTSISARTLT